MFIREGHLDASIASWKKSTRPDTLARELGEGSRSKYVSSAQRRHRFREILDQAQDPVVARTLLERIIEGNDLVGVNYLSIGAARARSICRIHLRDGAGRTVGYGTGFLVGPGVLMTNHHVIAAAEDARNSLAEFDYEYDVDGIDKPVASFSLLADPLPIAHQPLDFCLAAVAPRSLDGKRSLDEFGWLTLDGAPGKAIVGEYLTIIQHPGGERKQVCVRENKLLKYDANGTTLWYQTDTVAGSSGSPVFDGIWRVAALHHSGVPTTDAQGRWLTTEGKIWDPSMDEARVKWIANEGIRISAIVQYLARQHPNDGLAQAVLQPRLPPRIAPTPGPSQSIAGSRVEVIDDGLRLTIPLSVTMRLDMDGIAKPAVQPPSLRAAPASLPALTRDGARRVPLGVEAVSVDQSNYDERPGHDPTFLGSGTLEVPLPQITASVRDRASRELKYWNYSVVMNKERRMAFFSTVDVDPDRRPTGAGRDGDRWYVDPRIDARYQLDAEFYGHQRDLEADRSLTPFDRGHLTRRLDAQWGDNPDTAKRNGDDSFHWTNCAPQHWRYNQGAKRWLGLEDYVISGFARKRGRRAIVINGPVFDAPLSGPSEGGRVVPSLQGAAHPDPTFGNVPIPKMFFKIVVGLRGSALAAAAFLMSQEDLLATVERLQGLPSSPEEKLTDAEARLYQVSVAAIAELTGLDFGPLTGADVSLAEVLAPRQPLLIERLEQIRIS